MKTWISLTVTAMGFFLGIVLAEVGGLSAKTFFSSRRAESTKKIDQYWHETGISHQDVRKLVSNDKCKTSNLYYNACLNVIAHAALEYDLKVSAGGQMVRIEAHDHLDEMSERELLSLYTRTVQNADFDSLVLQLINLEQPAKRALQAAEMINSFMSVYLDPHTYILPTAYYEEVSAKLERSKFFVGVSYQKIRGEYIIRKVTKNSDSELAGLKAKDKIMTISSVPIRGLGFAEVGALLRDERPELVFGIKRGHQDMKIVMKRTYRYVSHVQYDLVPNDGKNYALITLSKFTGGVCREMSKALKSAISDKVNGVVLDLRDNPGGQLNEAACISGLLLGKDKKAYYVEYFDQSKPNEVVLTSEEQVYDGPLIVLINGSSASSSELLAGGLKEYGRALIVGERSFGKGTFQEIQQWSYNPNVSIFRTEGFYLLPSRNSTHLVGVEPDIKLHPLMRSTREELAFFNPVQKKPKHYVPLKKSELTKVYLFGRCGAAPATEGEDSYLSESLYYLSCVRAVKGTALAQSSSLLFN